MSTLLPHKLIDDALGLRVKCTLAEHIELYSDAEHIELYSDDNACGVQMNTRAGDEKYKPLYWLRLFIREGVYV